MLPETTVHTTAGMRYTPLGVVQCTTMIEIGICAAFYQDHVCRHVQSRLTDWGGTASQFTCRGVLARTQWPVMLADGCQSVVSPVHREQVEHGACPTKLSQLPAAARCPASQRSCCSSQAASHDLPGCDIKAVALVTCPDPCVSPPGGHAYGKVATLSTPARCGCFAYWE